MHPSLLGVNDRRPRFCSPKWYFFTLREGRCRGGLHGGHHESCLCVCLVVCERAFPCGALPWVGYPQPASLSVTQHFSIMRFACPFSQIVYGRERACQRYWLLAPHPSHDLTARNRGALLMPSCSTHFFIFTRVLTFFSWHSPISSHLSLDEWCVDQSSACIYILPSFHYITPCIYNLNCSKIKLRKRQTVGSGEAFSLFSHTKASKHRLHLMQETNWPT